jgi:hypothetical protein
MTHQVVPIQRDVERAGGHVVPVDVGDRSREAAGNRNAAGPDADQRELLDTAIAFENLVRNPGQRSPDPIGIHHHRHGRSSDRRI